MDCASRSLVAAALLNSLGRTPEKSPFAAHSQAELVALVSSLSKPHLIEILGRLDEPSLRGLLVRSIEAAAPKSGAACPVCRKEFASVGRLNAHMVGHSSARSFKCLVCHKGFLRRHHLNDHIRAIHENARPFGCPVCGKSFCKKSSLTRHRQTHLLVADGVLSAGGKWGLAGLGRVGPHDFDAPPFGFESDGRSPERRPAGDGKNYETYEIELH